MNYLLMLWRSTGRPPLALVYRMELNSGHLWKPKHSTTSSYLKLCGPNWLAQQWDHHQTGVMGSFNLQHVARRIHWNYSAAQPKQYLYCTLTLEKWCSIHLRWLVSFPGNAVTVNQVWETKSALRLSLLCLKYLTSDRSVLPLATKPLSRNHSNKTQWSLIPSPPLLRFWRDSPCQLFLTFLTMRDWIYCTSPTTTRKTSSGARDKYDWGVLRIHFKKRVPEGKNAWPRSFATAWDMVISVSGFLKTSLRFSCFAGTHSFLLVPHDSFLHTKPVTASTPRFRDFYFSRTHTDPLGFVSVYGHKTQLLPRHWIHSVIPITNTHNRYVQNFL